MMSLSDAAYRKIVWIRGEYAREFPADPPETFGVAVGQYTSKAGEVAPPNVAVGFFRSSDMNAAIRAARRPIRGLTYVAMGSPETKQRIEGSMVDYSEAQGFFLRSQRDGTMVAVDDLFPSRI